MCECGCEAETIERLFDQQNLPNPHGAFSLTRKPDYQEWTHEHEGCELVHAGRVCETIRGLFRED